MPPPANLQPQPLNTQPQPLGSLAEQYAVSHSDAYVQDLLQKNRKLEAQRDARWPTAALFMAFVLGLGSCDFSRHSGEMTRVIVQWAAGLLARND